MMIVSRLVTIYKYYLGLESLIVSVCSNTIDSVMESNYDDLYCIVIDQKKIFT